jgi:type II secretion system protein N
MKVTKIDWNLWRPRIAYGAFALAAFALSLRWTFPGEAMKERLIMEAGRRGWQIEVERVSAGGLLGVHAEGVKLETDTGLAIPLDGRRSIAFAVAAYDGRVEGTADLSGDARRVVVDVRDLDLARALPLRKASGLDLVGKLAGKADVVVPAAADQRPTGRVDVTVKDAAIAGGQLPVPGMTSGLTLPRMGLGAVVASLKLGDGKGTFERLEATGGDAEVRTEGLYFLVQPRMEFSPVFGKARVKVHDAFWARSETQSFKGLAEMALASAKGSDGTWSFQVTGSVGHPRMQPQPAR